MLVTTKERVNRFCSVCSVLKVFSYQRTEATALELLVAHYEREKPKSLHRS